MLFQLFRTIYLRLLLETNSTQCHAIAWHTLNSIIPCYSMSFCAIPYCTSHAILETLSMTYHTIARYSTSFHTNCFNLLFVLRFPFNWATPGYRERSQGIVSTQCPYRVLHAIERHQGTMSEAEGLSQLNACIVCYGLSKVASLPGASGGGFSGVTCNVLPIGHFWLPLVLSIPPQN